LSFVNTTFVLSNKRSIFHNSFQICNSIKNMTWRFYYNLITIELESTLRRSFPTWHPWRSAVALRDHGQLRLRLLQHLRRTQSHGRAKVALLFISFSTFVSSVNLPITPFYLNYRILLTMPQLLGFRPCLGYFEKYVLNTAPLPLFSNHWSEINVIQVSVFLLFPMMWLNCKALKS